MLLLSVQPLVNNNMFMGILTLLTALAMATTAAVFAIFGIVALFAGMPAFAIVMGSVIELGKIVGVSWLYRNWEAKTKIKYALLPLVCVAMLLTSLGVFGLLSKAHLEQTAPVLNNQIQIERLEQQISRETSKIADADAVIQQLDQSVQVLINFDRIRGPDGALAVRESQADQRELLRQTILEAQTIADQLLDEQLLLTQELRAVELEVGPVKYLAELIYGDGTNRTEEAVRWVIIAFIFVFDPMAILLLMAANYSLTTYRGINVQNTPTPQEPEIENKIQQLESDLASAVQLIAELQETNLVQPTVESTTDESIVSSPSKVKSPIGFWSGTKQGK
jgi:hypothetical protein